MEINCEGCGVIVDKPLSKINYNKKMGYRTFCTYKCAMKNRKLSSQQCPVCGKDFIPYKQHGNIKSTCSFGCANTFFRSGKNNPNYKGTNGTQYRGICFEIYPHKCAVCEESNVIEVHHLDKNRSNNSLENLVPLCPTHHQYMHRKQLQPLIETKLAEWQKQYGGMVES